MVLSILQSKPLPFLAVNQMIKNKLSKRTFLIYKFKKKGGGGGKNVCVGGAGGCVYGGGEGQTRISLVYWNIITHF